MLRVKFVAPAIAVGLIISAGCCEREVDRTPGLPSGLSVPSPSEPPMTLDLGEGVKLELMYINAGKFLMGSDDGDDDERPAHEVKITEGFYMGKYEVTQAQYERMMGTSPGYFSGADRPVEQVSWDDAMEFCRKAGQMAGRRVRLPTEAEWEYACRAGTTGMYYYGDHEGRLRECAWYSGNSSSQTHAVGQKMLNAWGLYDMHGNVWEWCADMYDREYYRSGPRVDPKGPASGDSRVLRGGSWDHGPRNCRSACRNSYGPEKRNMRVGFRVAADPQ